MRKLLLICLTLFLKVHSQDLHSSHTSSSVFFEQPDVIKNAGIRRVRCLFKDSRSFMWIGTENGLYRYDGTNIVSIQHRPNDGSSIPDNTVVSIAEDKVGMIWLGTLSGVARLHPQALTAKSFRAALHNLKGDYDNRIYIGRNGEVWTGNSMGVERFNPQKKLFEPMWSGVESSKQSFYVMAITQFHKDSLLLGTFTDVVAFNIHDHGFRRKRLLNSNITVTSLLYDSHHHVWIGTWNAGELVLDSLLSEQSPSSAKHWSGLRSGNIVTAMAESRWHGNSCVWINGDNGLYKVPCGSEDGLPDLRRGVYINTDPIRKDVSPGIIADKDGFVWFASPQGVFKFAAGRDYFRKLPLQIDGNVIDIQRLRINGRDDILLPTWYGRQGVIRMDEKSLKAVAHYLPVPYVDNPDARNISSIGQDRFGRLWIPSLGGLVVTDSQMRLIHDFRDNPAADKPFSNKVSGVFVIHDTAWVLCYKRGIDLFDLNFHKLKHFSAGDSGLREDLFWRMLPDSAGRIWLCGNAYFYRYFPYTNHFKTFDFSTEQAVYAPVDMAQMPNGHLVVATRIGLIDFDPLKETFKKITSPLLQKEEIVQSVAVDARGDPWFITAGHLVHYQPASGHFTLFDEEDGLDTQNELLWLRSFDGYHFLLAQQHAMVTFMPVGWDAKEQPPVVFVHALQVNDSAMRSPAFGDTVRLAYNENKVYIEFDEVNFVKPAQNQYAYMLTGVDKAWNFTNRNIASYANLAPGWYAFKVKAGNYAGNWSKVYQLFIFIRAPFWKTWWFIVVGLLVAGLLFFRIVRYISRRNLIERILRLEKEQAVEKERNRIARDMHDDLGSGLTKIAVLSEVAKAQLHQSLHAEVQLEKISRSSRELLDNLQDIIWVLNPRNDSLESLALYTREYASKFMEGLDIELKFNFPSTLPAIRFSEEERRNIFLVIKETLNNIAKHSACKSVEISLHILNNRMVLTIRDDGKGFSIDKVRGFANGLVNMRYRMEQIGGHYEIDASPGLGAVTTLWVPV